MTTPDADAGSSRVLLGSCLCGAVRYAVEDSFDYAAICHCANCRRATGSAFKPFAGIAREALRLTHGEDLTLLFGESKNHDLHCKTCGSLLYSVVRNGRFAHVAMGTLIDAPSIRPTHHIFVGSKAPWHTITDNLQQFEGHATPRGDTDGPEDR